MLGLLFVALAFFSCTESIVEIKLPDHDPRLVLTALLKDEKVVGTNDKNTLYFTSSTSSIGLSQTLDPDIFFDGKFSFFENGDAWEGPFFTSIGYSGEHDYGRIVLTPNQTGLHFIYGNNYTFEAEIEGYPSIRTEQTMPYPPEYTSLEFDAIKKIDSKFTPYYTAILSFEDPVEKNDHYHIQAYIEKRHDPNEKYFVWTWSTEDNFLLESSYDNSIIMSDEEFNGKVHTLELRIDSRFVNKTDDILKLNFARITQDGYRFHRSYQQYISSQQSPFSEPTITFSNIENGFGIFSLAASSPITIIP